MSSMMAESSQTDRIQHDVCR